MGRPEGKVSKARVLGRIRAALRDVSAQERPEDVPVARDYLTRDALSEEERLELFALRAEDYRVTVRRCAERELAQSLAQLSQARGARRLVVPADLPAAWRAPGLELLPDEALPYEALEQADGALTGCALAIAQTGTIVLDGGAAQGRRALSLLPDYHLCVVFASQLVGLVPEALERLEASARAGRPITFISGPSATSDIELSRVEGVHGPRTLEVLLVTGG